MNGQCVHWPRIQKPSKHFFKKTGEFFLSKNGGIFSFFFQARAGRGSICLSGTHHSEWHLKCSSDSFWGFFHSIWFRDSETKNGFPQEGGMQADFQTRDNPVRECAFFWGPTKHIQLHRGSNWGELGFAGPTHSASRGVKLGWIEICRSKPSQGLRPWLLNKSQKWNWGLRPQIWREKSFPRPNKNHFFHFFKHKMDHPIHWFGPQFGHCQTGGVTFCMKICHFSI